MFSKTSQNIRLQGNSILVADCKKQDGSSKSSSLDLDTLLGNVDGKFTRGQQTFSKTARNIALKGLILSAELKNSSEVWVPATVDLDALIANNDGLLEGVSVTGLAKMFVLVSSLLTTILILVVLGPRKLMSGLRH